MESNEKVVFLQEAIERLNNKDFKIIFYSPDVQGMPNSSTLEIYRMSKVLSDVGYDTCILHDYEDYDKNDPKPSWLEDEFNGLKHVNINNANEVSTLSIKVSDFLIIPEISSWFMEETTKKNFPCERIVFLNSVDVAMHALMVGFEYKTWGINNILTLSDKTKEWVESVFRSKYDIKVNKVEVPDFFKPSLEPKDVSVAVYSKNFNDFNNKILKPFYLKYPHLNFINFRPIGNVSREECANILSKSMLSLWIDRVSGFGTFPLESMATQTLPVGLLPDNRHVHINFEEDTVNGAWCSNVNDLLEALHNVIIRFLQRGINNKIYQNMNETVKEYTPEISRKLLIENFEYFINKRKTVLLNTLNKEQETTNN